MNNPEKSYVSLEQHVCPACGAPHAVGVLFDKRLHNSLYRTTTTGYSLCPEHQKLSDDSYLLLVEIDERKSTFGADGSLQPSGAYRTGTIIGLKRKAAAQILTTPTDKHQLIYIDCAAVEKIKQLQESAV